MEEVVEIMDTPKKMKPIVGPLGIVKLWLNAILANHITPEIDIPTHFKLKIKGARLTYLTPSKEFCTYECYTKYIKAFLNFAQFDNTLALFWTANSVGPEWLNLRFPLDTPSQQAKLVKIWSSFLSWGIIYIGTTSKDLKFYLYQPHIFTRQFGLCQLPPIPIYKKRIHYYKITFLHRLKASFYIGYHASF